MNIDDYLSKQKKEKSALSSELSKESDRGCALYGASYLESALSDLLYCSLAMDKNIEKELFDGTAPLSSFSARINMAYYLGKLSKNQKVDLHVIKKIRNEFAHVAKPMSFDSDKVSDRCKGLSMSYHEPKSKPRAHFTAALFGLLSHIESETLKCKAPEIMPDNAPSKQYKREFRESLEKQVDELLASNKPGANS